MATRQKPAPPRPFQRSELLPAVRVEPLNPKHERFVAEYLVDLNATQAAVRAGYSKRTAGQIGYELLKKPEIAAVVAARTREVIAKAGVTAEEVVGELRRVALSDMRQFASWGPDGVTLKSSADLPEDAARCVAEVVETRSEGGSGEDLVAHSSLRFKLHPKVTALETLLRYLGLTGEQHAAGGTRPIQVVVVHQVVNRGSPS